MRRLATPVLVLAMLVLSAVPALGAVDQGKLQDIKGITQQMYTLKVQLIDKQVEAGIMDQAKAEKIKSAMQERQLKIEQEMDKGEFTGLGHKKGCCGKNSTAQKAN